MKTKAIAEAKIKTDTLLKIQVKQNALVIKPNLTIDKVMTGELELKDLIVSKILRQDLYKYRSSFHHVSAAVQLTEAGVTLTHGDTIQYVYRRGVFQSTSKGDPRRIYRRLQDWLWKDMLRLQDLGENWTKMPA